MLFHALEKHAIEGVDDNIISVLCFLQPCANHSLDMQLVRPYHGQNRINMILFTFA